MTAVTVSGIIFEINLPYAVGHKISASEANALNYLYVNNILSQFKPLVTKAQRAAGKMDLSEDVREDLIKKLQYMCENHKFVSRVATAMDPVQRMAFDMAKPLVINALKQQDIDLKTIDEEKMEKIILSLLEKRPDIIEEAKRRISALAAVAEKGISTLTQN